MLSLMESGGIAFLLSIFVTPLWIRFVSSRSMGQLIREDGPSHHHKKAGTPTMGGVVIVGSAFVGYCMGHVGTALFFTRSGELVMTAILASGLLGFVDDYLAIRNKRNLGLNKRGKFIGQFLIAVGFAFGAVYWVHTATSLSLTRASWPGIPLSVFGWIAFAILVVIGTSNAVNLTDGLDGLAIIGYWQFRHYHLYLLHASLDLGLIAVAMVGACLGFLWWNAAPAHIMMGDTGSLAIGTALGGLCLLMNLDLLLVVIGGLFVAETLSVIMQVISFRLFKKRIFRMAPIHHHFELLGWPETTVIVRFWIFAGLLAALGLGIFYADFVRIARFV